jgi:hypothetical protein
MTVDELLNLSARVLLRACSPLTAHAVLSRLGRVLPQHLTREDVRQAFELLRRGSCLSRSLAIAARAPSADVVIGVRPEGPAGLFAHAWLEVDGIPLRESDPAGREIARLSGQHRRQAKGAGWSARPRI